MPISRLTDYRELLANIQKEIADSIKREKCRLNVPIQDVVEARLIRARVAGLEQANRIVEFNITEGNRNREFVERQVGHTRSIRPNKNNPE